jgi:hypothetical protein
MTPQHPSDLAARARQRLAAARPEAAPQTRPKNSTKGKGADRWAMLNTFVDAVMRDAGDAELRVWLVLYRDARGTLAQAGMTDIARRAGLTRRGVVKAINALKIRGLLEVTVRGTINGRPNTYRLKAPT